MVDILLSVVSFGVLLTFRHFFLSPENIDSPLTTSLSMEMFCGHWHSFLLGFFLRKYNLIGWLGKHNNAYSLGLLIFIAALSFYLVGGPTVLNKLVGLAACIVFFISFYWRENNTSFLEDKLAHIGRHTLNIYIFHYFLLKGIDFSLNTEWMNNNLFISVIIEITLAVIVSYICIFVGQVLQKSRLLDEIVYGKFVYRIIKQE